MYGLLESQKLESVLVKLYPKARHELHNEKENIKTEFFEDVKNWLNENVEKSFK